jgi:type IV pilus assembly protein PilN
LIRINLSPKKVEKKKENVRLQIWMIVLALTVVFAGCYFVYSRQASKIRQLEGVLAQKIEIRNQFESSKKQLNDLVSKQQELEKRRAVIRELIAKRDVPIRILDALSQTIIPEKLWLVKVTEQGSSMTLEGFALDNQTVAQYMKTLEDLPLFANVQLELSQQQVLAEIKLQKFVIRFGISS